MVAVGFWAYTSLTLKNPKEKEHLRRLKEKAQSDELAKKQFEKLERRNKRRRRRGRKNIVNSWWSTTFHYLQWQTCPVPEKFWKFRDFHASKTFIRCIGSYSKLTEYFLFEINCILIIKADNFCLDRTTISHDYLLFGFS